MAGQEVYNGSLPSYTVAGERNGATELIQAVTLNNGLVPTKFDEEVYGYTGNDLTTITYKLASATVGVVTMEYVDSRVTRRYRSA